MGRLLYTLGLLGVTLGLVVYRQAVTGTVHYGFLYWNLMLAFIPLVVAGAIRLLHPVSDPLKLTLSWLLFPLWLSFFPNAPYMLTDLMHVYRPFSMPFWYDPIMLCSAAFSGLFAGFISLNWVQITLGAQASPRGLSVLTFLLWPLTGLGIYLGRILRWNSWDVISRPVALMGDIALIFRFPGQHQEAWLLISVYTMVLIFLYGVWQSPSPS